MEDAQPTLTGPYNLTAKWLRYRAALPGDNKKKSNFSEVLQQGLRTSRASRLVSFVGELLVVNSANF
eukprot:1191622-Amphidinium_carterae.1